MNFENVKKEKKIFFFELSQIEMGKFTFWGRTKHLSKYMSQVRDANRPHSDWWKSVSRVVITFCPIILSKLSWAFTNQQYKPNRIRPDQTGTAVFIGHSIPWTSDIDLAESPIHLNTAFMTFHYFFSDIGAH